MDMDLLRNYLVPGALAFMMFGLGLSLSAADFARIAKFPRAAAVGLTGQLVALPLAAIALTVAAGVNPEVGVGLIILAACPGGVSSNVFSFAARADVALSVTLTAVTSLVALVTIPLLTLLALAIHTDGGQVGALPIGAMVWKLFRVTALPVMAGMTLRHLAPVFTARTEPFFRRAVPLVLVALVTITVFANFEHMKKNLADAVPVSIALNLGTMALGYWWARLARLDRAQTITIVYEIGVQNVAIAVMVALTLIGNVALSVVPIIYGVTMMITAFLLLAYLRWHDARAAA